MTDIYIGVLTILVVFVANHLSVILESVSSADSTFQQFHQFVPGELLFADVYIHLLFGKILYQFLWNLIDIQVIRL